MNEIIDGTYNIFLFMTRLKEELEELPQSIESLRKLLKDNEDTLESLHK